MSEDFKKKQIEHVVAQIPLGKSVRINLHDMAVESGATAEEIMNSFIELEKRRTILVTELLKGTVIIKRNS